MSEGQGANEQRSVVSEKYDRMVLALGVGIWAMG